MLRTNNCGELGIINVNQKVVLCGWVQKSRDLGGMTFIDLRDRFGITQLVFNMEADNILCEKARKLGREYVIKVTGTVSERSSKNLKMKTGEIEIIVESIEVLNQSKTPPFTIEDDTDGGEDLRMKYRYLDIRRSPVRDNLILRSNISKETRAFLSNNGFLEIETPVLIKSTPEGARDFLVPSRINKGQFYALPQSPQTFKQLLMVAGLDRYFQIVKCFRDEDLRADRQPEFTQIDCELSFVDQNDIISIFSDFVRHIFKSILDVEIGEIPIMEYKDAIEKYGNDKPDTRFDLLLNNLNFLLKGKGFKVFDEAETIIGFKIKGGSSLSRKQIDVFTNWIKRPQLGGNGLAYVKYSENELKSSFDKYIQIETLKNLAEHLEMENGDISFILAGNNHTTRRCASELRLEVANVLKLIKNDVFNCLWVVDFPLLEFDTDSNRWHAMHHPFTSPKSEDLKLLDTNPGKIRANAYDLVINGVEVGGGSIRIHNKELQNQMFKLLGFSPEDAESQFGFLMNAFEFGAPPHGGLAFGLDRLCAILGGSNSIRDFIAFPKNNSGRDVMIESPAPIDNQQLVDLGLMRNE